ncbi:MAG TPA: type II toxin-antitoxin system RelE/ParE family toxin [Candidatus Acidoferrum sp.]
MAYEIERTDEFTEWWNALTEKEQIAIAKVVGVLAEKGPDLKRPYVGKIEGSKKMPNLKELIIQFAGNPYRVFFLFDERRVGILLLGARKTGGKKAQAAWYKAKIAEVEPIYEQYVAELEEEGLI